MTAENPRLLWGRREFLVGLGVASLSFLAKSAGAFDLPHRLYFPEIKNNFTPGVYRFQSIEQLEGFVEEEDSVQFSDFVHLLKQGNLPLRVEIAQRRMEKLPRNKRYLQVVVNEGDCDRLIQELPEGMTPYDYFNIHAGLMNNMLQAGWPLLEGLVEDTNTSSEAELSELVILRAPAEVAGTVEYFPSAAWISNQWPKKETTGLTYYPFSRDVVWASSNLFGPDFWRRYFRAFGQTLNYRMGDVHEHGHAEYYLPDLYHLTGRISSSDPLYNYLRHISFCPDDIMSVPVSSTENFENPRLGPLNVLVAAIHQQKARSLQFDGWQPFLFPEADNQILFGILPQKTSVRFRMGEQILTREQIKRVYLLSEFKKGTEALQEIPWDEKKEELILTPKELEPWHAIVDIEWQGEKLFLPLPRYVMALLPVLGDRLLGLPPAETEGDFEVEIKRIPQGPHSLRIEVLYPWELEQYLENSEREGWLEVARSVYELNNDKKVFILWMAPESSFSREPQTQLAGERIWQREIEEVEKGVEELRQREGTKFVPKPQNLTENNNK